MKATPRAVAAAMLCLLVAIFPTVAPAAAANAAAKPALASSFGRAVDEFVFESLALSPVGATASGYHEHKGVVLDDLLDDFSAEGLAKEHQVLKGFEARFAAFDQTKFDKEENADMKIAHDAIALMLLDLDEIQTYQHNPASYVELIGNALYTPYVLQYAPAPERFKHIIARLKRIPALIGQAQANLTDAPEVWNQVAREEDTGDIELIDKELRGACPESLRKDYAAAAAPAIDALKGFDGWLTNRLSEKKSDWRLGAARYDQKFRLTLQTGKTPEQLLSEAEADLAKTHAEMEKLAAPKTVAQALDDIAKQHASRDTYMASARDTLAAATSFVKAKDLLTLGSTENLTVIETPEFMRGIYGVGGFNPAPALEPKLGAFFWVTPIPKSWDDARVESKLREYNTSGMQHLTVHEAMPGHYVQGEYANAITPRSRRLLRAIYGNGAYVEGWAVYAQQMMAEQGFAGDTAGYRLTLAKQMLRVLTNTILDVKLQTQHMTDQAALDLMMQQAFQEREEASAKLQRAKLSSCQLPTYYAGLKGWLQVREDYRAHHGAEAPLKQFHEAALREGAVPLPVLDGLLN